MLKFILNIKHIATYVAKIKKIIDLEKRATNKTLCFKKMFLCLFL